MIKNGKGRSPLNILETTETNKERLATPETTWRELQLRHEQRNKAGSNHRRSFSKEPFQNDLLLHGNHSTNGMIRKSRECSNLNDVRHKETIRKSHGHKANRPNSLKLAKPMAELEKEQDVETLMVSNA